MLALRVYLLVGLIVHKAVWESLKRRGHAVPPPDPSLGARLVKGVKLAMLFGLVAQTMLPEVLPITTAAGGVLRLAGAAVYTLGIAVALLGRIQLGDNWSDIESARVGRGQVLVSTGIYRYVRHPIYTGDLLLLFGFQLALNSWLVLGVVALTPIIFRQAVREEAMLASTFSGYETYASRTKRFVPFLV